VDNFAVNIRRLLCFHFPTNRQAAEYVGVSEHAISAWITGKRRPNLDGTLKLAELFAVDPRDLAGDPVAFAGRLGDVERIMSVEAKITGRGQLVEHPTLGRPERTETIKPQKIPEVPPPEAVEEVARVGRGSAERVKKSVGNKESAVRAKRGGNPDE
jgi:transcriptional regulator with XRE-family HTH domain